MTQLTLFGAGHSTFVQTVQLVFEEKGLAYTYVPASQYSEDQHDLQPFGKVPALTDGDFHLHETLAIAQYLDSLKSEPRLVPSGNKEAAIMYKWISIACDYGREALIRNWLLRENGALPADEVAIAEAKASAVILFGQANSALCNDDFLAGDQISLADLFVFPQILGVATLDEAHDIIEGFDRLSSWYAHMLARPSARQLAA